MQIKGFMKTTLLDYPDKLASVIFTGGCNFRCPYCHNSELVIHPQNLPTIMEEVVIEHLKKRKGIIDGLVISGGEPTLRKGLLSFMKRVKNEGVQIKLDTNGYQTDILKEVLQSGLVDYVAMDLKSTYDQYDTISGISGIDTKNIERSIELILNSGIDYEFRTTVLKDFHSYEDVLEIGSYLKNAKRFIIQQYMFSEQQLTPIEYEFYTREEMGEIETLIKAHCEIDEVILRCKY